MTDKAKTKTILSLICNCVIFLVTTGIFISYFFVKTKLIQSGWQSLRFFTTDSNLLTAVAAAPVAVLQAMTRALIPSCSRPDTTLRTRTCTSSVVLVP